LRIKVAFITGLLFLALGTAFSQALAPRKAFSQDIEYQSYSGTMGDGIKIGMWLAFDGEHVTGAYFYVKYLKYIYLKGDLDGSGTVELREYDCKGKQTALFKGRFLAEDPEKKFQGKLDKEVLSGVWVEGNKSFPFILRWTHTTTGPRGFGRYPFSKSYDEDEKIEQTIQAFREAVAGDRRKEVARYFNYPLWIWREEEKIAIKSETEFVENYDYIIQPWLKKAIIESVPKNMFNHHGDICLGKRCAVWFDSNLKVIWPESEERN